MIVVQLQGGLGNQLFQYATARHLSLYHRTTLRIDATWYHNIPSDLTPRSFDLAHYNIQAPFATASDISTFYPKSLRRPRHLYFTLLSKLGIGRRVVFRESQLGVHDSTIFDTPKNVYLIGFWQSEQYFRKSRAVLLQDLTLRDPLDGPNREVKEHIQAVQAVSLHIRRGDYASNPLYSEIHGVLPLDYYQTAAQEIARTVEKPHIFVFSDDISWVRENLRLDYPLTFVDHNPSDKHYLDMYLMSLCQHHIIANSSFSWWGAWLSTNPSKIVFAPLHWFQKTEYNTRDTVPQEWRRL